MSEPESLDAELLRAFPLPYVPEDSGKEDRGRLLVIAGSRELAGAARLSGVAALRAGAGKLQIGTAQSIAAALAVAIPEARVIGHAETDDGCIAEEGIAPLVRWAKAAQAVAVGCGMQPGRPLEQLLAALLDGGAGCPLVLDAAVLDCLPSLCAQVCRWPNGVILLPHAGEMARLLGRDRGEIEADPAEAAREAARRFNAHALVKGGASFIAAPGGRTFRLEGGGVGLATSGSGDVLAGIVGGLCARGADPLTALLWGTWLHAQAGRRLTKRVGRIGFLARELPDEIPALLPANREA
ncbi:NAD(P)H-hydrate dehydratase [Sphingosinicella sp. CPCC 101087]|uniref:NAD(P)H-hydrate dehydratase n=1 Tax=Sphingosinicella sp. CPCC 101087 TaxID=2497754 RepID=UPI00101E142E|nr:NAD(P)H-hydrate dehydratase [Sphingosinicella sp. CPCC 101087]